MTTEKTFDVILATGAVWNSEGEYVYVNHIQNHLRLLNESGYYALRVRNSLFRRGGPELFRGISKNLTHLHTTPISEHQTVHVWQS